ncbi:MAG: FAD-dependent oxidoreductase, partial [Planctomycetes bacterium]|nr:FAD-dependent oxidoreductase [Planctomycetota bacterium]
MDTIREEAREIPVVATCDVCVVGGSCTGVFAAVRAAQLGAKACLVENNGFFGGVATAGLVNLWHSLYDTTGKRQIIAGLTAEMLDRLRRRGAAVQRGTVPEHYELNPAELVLELDALVTEAGVQPFLHTRF